MSEKGIGIAITGQSVGEVLAAATVSFGDSADTSDVEAKTLRAQLRRLADRIAKGLDRLEGESRYQRFAVMPFEESGTNTSENQLGRRSDRVVIGGGGAALHLGLGVSLLAAARLGADLQPPGHQGWNLRGRRGAVGNSRGVLSRGRNGGGG